MHYQLERIHGVLGEKFMVEIINSFNRTFSYALLSTAGVARRLMACSLLLFSVGYISLLGVLQQKGIYIQNQDSSQIHIRFFYSYENEIMSTKYPILLTIIIR